MDLERLGAALRERREAMGTPRTEVARRVGVTPTYIWLVENARPRQGGQPSRPAEAVIERWTRALGMDERYTRQALRLAGYGNAETERETMTAAPTMPILDSRMAAPSGMRSVARALRAPASGSGSPDTETSSFVRAPIRFEQPRELQSDVLQQQLRDVLELSETAGRRQETAAILESFLEWLHFRVERAE